MLQAQRQCPAMRHGGQWRAYPGILRSLQIRRPLLAQQHANRDTANARITTALPNHTLRPKKANKHTYDDTLVHRKSVVSQNFTIFCRLEEHMSFCKKNNAVLCVSVVYWFLPEMCAVLAPFCAVFVVYLQALKMRTVLEGNSSMTQVLKTALSFRCPP